MEQLCPQEQTQQREHSPGLVASDEDILYLLLHPRHYADHGVTAEAFSKKKLMARSLSVARQRHTSRVELEERVIKPQLARNQQLTFVGMLRAHCASIRALTMRGGRAVCVIDDALAVYPGHAVLGFAATTPAFRPSEQVAIRERLLEVFGGQQGPLSWPRIFGG
jgi:hypothetical protein